MQADGLRDRVDQRSVGDRHRNDVSEDKLKEVDVAEDGSGVSVANEDLLSLVPFPICKIRYLMYKCWV